MRLTRAIIKKIRKIRLKRWTLKYGAENHLLKPTFSKRKAKKIARMGFNENQWYIYDFDRKEKKCRKEYLTSFDRWNMRGINGEYRIILDDKRLFELIFSKYTNVPKILYFLKNRKIYDSNQNEVGLDDLNNVLMKQKLFFRMNAAGGGRGAHLIEYDSEKLLIDGSVSSFQDIYSFSDGTFSTFLTQLEYSSNIYPKSTNTIRMVTINDNGDFEIVACAHRFGTHTSGFVDNASSGGIFCNIDIDTGELDSAYSYFVNQKYDQHPDTGEQIKGIKIPYWNKVKKDLLTIHKGVPYLKLVAWDVVVQEDGKIAIIEGNASSDVILLQTKKGLRFEKLGIFLEKQNCIFK